jgi:hypothetical protein
MKEYMSEETIIEIVMRESTQSSGTDFDVYLDGKFIDGGIIVDVKNIPDVLNFVSGMMKNQSRYQMRDKPIEAKK